MATLGENIKKRRDELGLSQEELAAQLGYKSRSTIAKIETGENDITQSKIEAFARVLQTTPAKLMGWEDGKKEYKLRSIARLEQNEQEIDIELDNQIASFIRFKLEEKRQAHERKPE